MKSYNQYSFEEFIADDLFIEWVLGSNREQDSFWAKFMQQYPEKVPTILKAKDFILEIHEVETLSIPPESFQKNWAIIKGKTGLSTTKIVTTSPQNTWWKYAVAATLLGVFLLAGRYYYPTTQSLTKQTNPTKTATKVQWTNFKNTTAIAQQIPLADGSKVILEPFSSLKYPSRFEKKQREVVLKGEAFFEVAKDTTKPFVVYANETITKVLGTSFTIKAFEGEKEVEVAVKTGKVAVYANVNSLPKKIIKEKEKFVVRTDEEQLIIPIPNKKLEVTPNQRVVFDKVKAEMQKTVAKLPMPTLAVKQLSKLHFTNEPLSEVLAALEQAYEIDLNFEEEKLNNCLITTTLENNVSLFSKLNIICRAMGLTYQEQEAVVYISGTCE